MSAVETIYAQNAFLAIFLGAFTPIPYKAMTISAGIFHINLTILLTASIVGRGARFFALALCIRVFGVKIKAVIERYFNVISTIFLIILIVGIFVFKYFF
jgi:membrane protein DedA with SNARE-associated domain